MGFTQLWLNPVQQNDQPRASYHGYAITDFYRIDDRLGSNALYRSLVSEARSKGVGVIMDVILNHCGSEHWWMKDLPDPDWINHTGLSSPPLIGVKPCRTRISRARTATRSPTAGSCRRCRTSTRGIRCLRRT